MAHPWLSADGALPPLRPAARGASGGSSAAKGLCALFDSAGSGEAAASGGGSQQQQQQWEQRQEQQSEAELDAADAARQEALLRASLEGLVAGEIQVQTFGPGEPLMLRGQPGAWCLVLALGQPLAWAMLRDARTWMSSAGRPAVQRSWLGAVASHAAGPMQALRSCLPRRRAPGVYPGGAVRGVVPHCAAARGGTAAAAAAAHRGAQQRPAAAAAAAAAAATAFGCGGPAACGPVCCRRQPAALGGRAVCSRRRGRAGRQQPAR